MNKADKIENLRRRNHYNDLRKNFVKFATILGVPDAKYLDCLISAHGDKCDTYKETWENEGIPFSQGVAIYLLSYIRPYSEEVRKTLSGWIHPYKWVITMYNEPEVKAALEQAWEN